MARTRAGLAILAAALAGAALVSGGASSDPRTPEGIPGLPPPFLTTAVLGGGGLSAGVDAYGDVVDLRPGPAGRALIDNPIARQRAGTVAAGTGIVPFAAIGDAPPRALWTADAIRQRYLPGTNVLRTEARFGTARVAIECATGAARLGCLSESHGGRSIEVDFETDLSGGRGRVSLDDATARALIRRAAAGDRRWLSSSAPLGAAAGDRAGERRPPTWARRLYRRSLLVMRALSDRRSGAVAAGARDGWAYVWPRDAGAVAIALASAGHREEARRVARFLGRLDLAAAARFDGRGAPVPGRAAQGDAAGWSAAAARATGLHPPHSRPASGPTPSWRDRPDYQEKSPGDYLANALPPPTGR